MVPAHGEGVIDWSFLLFYFFAFEFPVLWLQQVLSNCGDDDDDDVYGISTAG